MFNLILASKSKVRKDILIKNNINCVVEPSNVDEDLVKESLLNEGANPELISKNLAELKANKISQKKEGEIVLETNKSEKFYKELPKIIQKEKIRIRKINSDDDSLDSLYDKLVEGAQWK